MKKLVLTYLIFVSSLSCNPNTKPENLISEDEMVTILIDIHLTEGLASTLPIFYDSSQAIYPLMEKEVFIKHDVLDSVFTSSIIYYLQDPSTMDRIYGRVIDSLVVRESSGGIEDKF